MIRSGEKPPLSTEGRLSDRSTIAILSPLIVGSYLGEVISGVAAAADAAGLRVIAIQTLDLSSIGAEPPVARAMMHVGGERTYVGWPTGSEDKVPRFGLRAGWDRVAGFIVVHDAVEPWYLHALRAAGKHVVIVSDEPEGFSCPVVHTDNRTGIIEAVSHLVGHGHRRIAFAGSLAHLDIRERRDAYCDALALHGLLPEVDLFFEATDNLESGGTIAGGRMLAAGMPSTAVVAGTDYNALGIMKVLRGAGLLLPRDQAITGFDDVQAAAEFHPALSTVRQRAEQTGQTAANLLFDMLRGKQVARGPHLVPARFVPRESCGCAATPAGQALNEPSSLPLLSPRDRLRVNLQLQLLGWNPPTVQQTSALDGVADLIARQLEREATDPGSDRLSEAAQMLLSISPRWTTITTTMNCLLRYRRDLGSALDDGQTLARFEGSVRELGVQLGQSLQTQELGARNALDRAIGEEHQLTMSLLTGSAGDPRSLAWLSYTGARAGCLGLWSSESRTGTSDHSLLDLTGPYVRGGGRVRIPEQTRIEDFPPDGLFEEVEWEPGDIAVVVPVATTSTDLGLLAVVTPTDTSVIAAHDRLFEQGALLSVVIERELMTERLRRSNNDLATFSHAMAHDLRNPLATISMWTSVARAQVSPSDDTAPALQIMDKISDVARYANELVVDLLDYANLDRAATVTEVVDLNVAARRALMTVDATMAAQGATIHLGDLPTIRGRGAELEMVFQNLIENAIKYRSARPPRIRLTASRSRDEWKIRCRDNGEGIPADIRERIFEPFVRGDVSLPGSGIGLATCCRVVEGHGGRIWVEASGKAGTTITFAVPMMPRPEAVGGGHPEKPPAAGRSRAKRQPVS